MKSLILTSLFAFGINAMAQTTADINNIPGEFQPDPNVQQVEEPTRPQPSTGVVILNSQTASGNSSAAARTQAVLKNQPTTYVEASPLTVSRAEQLRKARQQAEVNTEQRIVEKLETSRLEDEKARANRLFGNKWTQPVQPPVQQAPPVYGSQNYQQPPVVVAPAVVDVDEKEDSVKKEELSEMKAEILDAVRESNREKMKLDDLEPKKKTESKTYIGAILGAGQYQADNVEADGALGFSIGSYLDDHFAIEGSFLYSRYNLDEYWKFNYLKEIDQYDFTVSAKYSVLPGRIKPFVMGSIAYIYRNYTDQTYDDGFYRRNRGFDDEDEITSNAVNAGLGFGLDFLVNERFSIGFEYRYSLNVFNNSDSDFLSRSDFREPRNTDPLEEVEYSVMAFTSKIIF